MNIQINIQLIIVILCIIIALLFMGKKMYFAMKRGSCACNGECKSRSCASYGICSKQTSYSEIKGLTEIKPKSKK